MVARVLRDLVFDLRLGSACLGKEIPAPNLRDVCDRAMPAPFPNDLPFRSAFHRTALRPAQRRLCACCHERQNGVAPMAARNRPLHAWRGRLSPADGGYSAPGSIGA